MDPNTQNNFSYPSVGGTPTNGGVGDDQVVQPQVDPIIQKQLDQQIGSLTPSFSPNDNTDDQNTPGNQNAKPANLDAQLSTMENVDSTDPAVVFTDPEKPPVVGLKEKVEAVEKAQQEGPRSENGENDPVEKLSPLQRLAQKLSGLGGGLVEENKSDDTQVPSETPELDNGSADNIDINGVQPEMAQEVSTEDSSVQEVGNISNNEPDKINQEQILSPASTLPDITFKEDPAGNTSGSVGQESSTAPTEMDPNLPEPTATENEQSSIDPALENVVSSVDQQGADTDEESQSSEVVLQEETNLSPLPASLESSFAEPSPEVATVSPQEGSDPSVNLLEPKNLGEEPEQRDVSQIQDNLGHPAVSVPNVEFDATSLEVHDERMDHPPALEANQNEMSPSDGAGIKVDPLLSVEEWTYDKEDETSPDIDDILPSDQEEDITTAPPLSEDLSGAEQLLGPTVEELANEESVSSTPARSNARYPYTIEQLMDVVVEKEASDLHITVGYPAMIRTDGELVPVAEEIVTEQNAVDLVLPVLPEQKKELLEVNREVDLAYSHREDARFRINAYYQQQSLAAAFRLIPNKIRSIEDLRLPQIYHQISKLRQGLVLVTGPTGSGKSTTLAAIIQEANETRPDHIITIEDPVEYVFPKARAMVDQRELHEDTHSWEIALKSALRQDPDIMLVGEMRDYDTISSAITLAETGHLVFATLHTNSASQTLDRIVDVFPEHQQGQVRSQLSNTIEAVIAQRLIPVNQGGRRAVSEIMLATPAIRNLIREAKTHQIDNVIRTSADIGMISLEHSLVKLVRDNIITMERAQEYAVHPEEIVRLLKS